MRSPQGGRHTGREVLREQRDAEGTRCIRAKVPLSCHTSRGDPRRAASGDPSDKAPACPAPCPSRPVVLFDWKEKRREGREGEARERSTFPLEPFALKLAGECLRQSLHTDYAEPLSGLKKIYYCLPNGSSVRNGCLFL